MGTTKKAIYMWPAAWRKPEVCGAAGAVSSNNVCATQAGLEILRQGGNAFDAAVAVSLTLSVVEPHHSGIGGGAFSLLYRSSDHSFHALDARGIAPKRATADLFLKDGEVQDEWKDLGGQAVAIPGLLRALDVVLKQYGTMSLAEVAAPAIRYAREGFPVSFTQSLTMDDDSVRRKRRLSPAFRALYCKEDGSAYRFGETMRLSKLADLLEKLTREGVDAFYTGEVAERIVSCINARGGCYTMEDLRDYQPKFRQPLQGTYRDHGVVAFPPPSSGATVLEMLNILEQFDLAAMGHNSADAIHTVAEAMKLGFADRSCALADPDFVEVDAERLSDKAFAARRAALIDPDVAGSFAADTGEDGHPGNTSHFVVMDGAGNVVSQTQTVRDWYGSGIVLEELGFVLNNNMSDFSAKSGAITSQGLTYSDANCIEGGKTPLSSMSPCIVMKNGKPWLAIGAAGGPRIITGILQGIVNAVDFGMHPEQLVRQPFITCLTKGQGLELEHGISRDTVEKLRSKGHEPTCLAPDMVLSSMLNCVMAEEGLLYPCATERVDGCGGVLLPDGTILLDGITHQKA